MRYSIVTYTPSEPLPEAQLLPLAKWLHHHLGEYRDPLPDILACLAYALGSQAQQGGSILIAEDAAGKPLGALVLNDTHMSGYVPAHLLVYIAVDERHRGQGIGHTLLETALRTATGGIALHVEPDNPARKLYEALGFTHKYIEMRYVHPAR